MRGSLVFFRMDGMCGHVMRAWVIVSCCAPHSGHDQSVNLRLGFRFF